MVTETSMNVRKVVARVCEKPFNALFPNWVKYLLRDLEGCGTVLDLGCGNNSFVKFRKNVLATGVDVHQQYLDESRDKGIHAEYIKADVRDVEFPDNSFDAVLLLALIEHMSKRDGEYVLRKAEKWASSKIILTTPNGYIDHYEIDDNPFQKHVCGWTVDELKLLGFEVHGTFGWKLLRGVQGKPKVSPAILGETLSGLTQYVTHYVPELSFVLYAVKENY